MNAARRGRKPSAVGEQSAGLDGWEVGCGGDCPTNGGRGGHGPTGPRVRGAVEQNQPVGSTGARWPSCFRGDVAEAAGQSVAATRGHGRLWPVSQPVTEKRQTAV